MSIRRVIAVVRKEIQHILRDRSTFVLVLLAPTAMLLLMAYALTVDIQHVPIAVLDYDRSPTSRDFVQQITAGDDLDLFAQVSSMEEVETLLMRGEIKVALVLGLISRVILVHCAACRCRSSSMVQNHRAVPLLWTTSGGGQRNSLTRLSRLKWAS